jgi:WhiB family redox-sensing transcriptional regulator
MPSPDHLPEQPPPLSPQVVADAAADTKRAWSADALCASVDPELFFPPGDQPATEARQICAGCAVRGECLAYAVIADEPFGIWGGLGPQERHTLRRQLQRRGELPSPDAGSAA